jgi:hypothetical protein
MNDQRSLVDQLRDLIPVANKMGSYDAADFLLQIVEPRSKNERKITGADVISGDFKLVKVAIGSLGKARLEQVIDSVVDHVVAHSKLSDDQAKNLARFMRMLSHEQRIDMWTKLSKECTPRHVSLIKSFYDHIKPVILEVFGM